MASRPGNQRLAGDSDLNGITSSSMLRDLLILSFALCAQALEYRPDGATLSLPVQEGSPVFPTFDASANASLLSLENLATVTSTGAIRLTDTSSQTGTGAFTVLSWVDLAATNGTFLAHLQYYADKP